MAGPTKTYPRRELSSEPFGDQLDVVEKKLIESQNVPLVYMNSRRKPIIKHFSNEVPVFHGIPSGQPPVQRTPMVAQPSWASTPRSNFDPFAPEFHVGSTPNIWGNNGQQKTAASVWG
ncbi:hypothetical protein CAAN1_16S01662 [[Candida] anglica]|uniref:Uncharacterized protein n=1 Tax=[Candida] anglica TaxID=148631 RepID=A0ABP0EA94_9ASCO